MKSQTLATALAASLHSRPAADISVPGAHAKHPANLRRWAACFLFSAFTLNAQVNQWDLAGDFPSLAGASTATNPNGAWSYGWKEYDGALPVGTFHVSATLAYNSSIIDWQGEIPGVGGGQVWKNYTSVTMYGIPPGQVSVNADSGATATVRFTVPVTGNYEMSGGFGWGDGGNGRRSVFWNKAELWRVAGAGSFDFTKPTPLALAAGDTLDFTIWGHNGGWGNTPVFATINLISPVPEPQAHGVMAALGLAGFGIYRRRGTHDVLVKSDAV